MMTLQNAVYHRSREPANEILILVGTNRLSIRSPPIDNRIVWWYADLSLNHILRARYASDICLPGCLLCSLIGCTSVKIVLGSQSWHIPRGTPSLSWRRPTSLLHSIPMTRSWGDITHMLDTNVPPHCVHASRARCHEGNHCLCARCQNIGSSMQEPAMMGGVAARLRSARSRPSQVPLSILQDRD